MQKRVLKGELCKLQDRSLLFYLLWHSDVSQIH